MTTAFGVERLRRPVPAAHQPFRRSLRAYLSVRGASLGDSARLYAGYAASAFDKFLRPTRYSCVGACLPGVRPLTIATAGIHAHVRPGTNDLDLLAHHEPRTREWFQVRDGDVVVDVGAHIGLYTLLAARSASRVLALEPDPDNFVLLQDNVRLNGFSNVCAIEAAASDRPGSVPLIPATGSNRGTSMVDGESSALGTSVSRAGTVVVRCDTLDRLLDPYKLGRIDWLKIDVEGHEGAVLAGAAVTLSRTRHLILEVMSGHEDAAMQTTAAGGMQWVGEEPGFPASNWFFERRSP
jgi:FkbM family methyltransferase